MVLFQFVMFKKIYEDICKNNINFQFKNKYIDEDLIDYFNFYQYNK